MSSERLDRGDGVHLAYALQGGAAGCPTVVFLPGFRSDMTGDKATALAERAASAGWPMLRLDYSGHGASEGRFEDGTIGRWRDDALHLIDRLTPGPLVLVGSSMGGWIALLVALARPGQVVGLVGIAAAPDFTEAHLWAGLPQTARATLLAEGLLRIENPYGPPMIVTRALIEDGRRHLLLGAPIGITCPVHLLHGQRDEQVPWQSTLTLADRLVTAEITVTLVKDGGHRLSRASDVALIVAAVERVVRQEGQGSALDPPRAGGPLDPVS